MTTERRENVRVLKIKLQRKNLCWLHLLHELLNVCLGVYFLNNCGRVDVWLGVVVVVVVVVGGDK